MASEFVGVIGLIVFVLACKNIVKTYKEKALWIKILLCVGLFIVAVILAELFLYLLNPNATPPAETSFIFLGFFADIISLILRFFHARKHHKKEAKEYKSVRNELIITAIVILAVFFFIFGSDIIKKSQCQYPNMTIGDQCCLPSTDYGMELCSSDAEKLTNQLKNVIENNILTTEHEETIMNNFTILIPKDYYLARNIKAGYIDILLYLVAYGKENKMMEIKVIYSQSSTYDGTIRGVYNEMIGGMRKTLPDAQYSEPVFLQNDKNNFELALFNVTMPNVKLEDTETTIYSSYALIKSGLEVIMIAYTSDSKEFFDYYHYDFENMVTSVDKK